MSKSKVKGCATSTAQHRPLWRRLLGDRGGNVAMMFGLAAIPFFTLGGMAVDYSRALMVKNRLGEALDATALALGTQTGLTAAQIQTTAQNYFNANYSVTNVGTPSTLTVSSTATTVTIDASADVPTLVLGLIGFNSIPVTEHVQVTRDSKNLEIALVLDNTGSMAGTKISTLKTAASNFVDTMSAAAGTSTTAVKISLVPYTMTVNIGTQYQTASWMTGAMPVAYGADIFVTPLANRFTLLSQMNTSWGGCVELRPHPYDVQDDAPSVLIGGTMYVPFFSPDEPDNQTSGYSSDYVNDYLTDYSGDNKKTWQIQQGDQLKYTKKPKTGTNGIGYAYGPNAGCIAQPLVRLSTNWSALKTAINGMVAGGDTIMHLGFGWGWNTLSPNAPFADGVSYTDPNTAKILIIMTDGENHNVQVSDPDDSVYGGGGYIWQGRFGMTSGTLDQRRVKLDSLLLQACANAKAKGIIVYSIMFDVADDAQDAPAMMQTCASSSDTYFLVTDVNQLSATFQSIANSIQHLRISQ